MASASGAPGGGRAFGLVEQRAGDGEPEGDGLARAGLGRDEQVAPRFGVEHGLLDGGRLGVAARVERPGEGSGERRKGQGVAFTAKGAGSGIGARF